MISQQQELRFAQSSVFGSSVSNVFMWTGDVYLVFKLLSSFNNTNVPRSTQSETECCFTNPNNICVRLPKHNMAQEKMQCRRVYLKCFRLFIYFFLLKMIRKKQLLKWNSCCVLLLQGNTKPASFKIMRH